METIYKNKKKTSNNLTEEERAVLNSPEYLHKCTKCGEFKPNTEYTVSRTAKGRKFFSACKVCVNVLYTKGIGKEARKKSQDKQRKIHRLRDIHSAAKGNAKKKNIEFSITKEDITELWQKQKGLCFYTGKPMFENITGLENNKDAVSIDRVVSKVGYIKDNIVLCRWVVNRIKNDLSIEELMGILKDINNIHNEY